MKCPLFLATICLPLSAVGIACANVGSAGKSPQIVTVPDSIAADLSKDVTAELNRWLADIPNGSTIRFPAKARYRLDGTLLIEGKQDLTIEGNSVLFRAYLPGEDHEKKTSYTGWKRTRSRAHIRITNSQRIHVSDIEVQGAHPNAGRTGIYDANREAQHGFDLVRVEDCRIENVNVHDVYGDCVYIAKAKGIVVFDSTLQRCGRQGIAVGTGEDVLIENNTIADSRRGIIDVEPYGKEWQATNIRIIGNRLGGSRLLLLPMGGSGKLGSVFVAENINTEHNGTPAVGNRGKPGQGRGPFVMVNNQFTIGGSPSAGLRVEHNDGVFIAGNALTFPANRKMTAVNAKGSTGAVVGNHFGGAADVIEESPKITELSNRLEAEAKPNATEWKQIPGGFAVRVELDDGEAIALMRGGPNAADRPGKITGYGQSTTAEFQWFHIHDEEKVGGGSRK